MKPEARELLARRVEELRRMRYRELQQFLGNPDSIDVFGPSGQRYGIETEAFWDDKRGGNLRVIVAIDDGGWRAFVPLTDDFIKTSDDQFVDEQ